MTGPGEVDIVDSPSESRYLVRGIDGAEAELVYRVEGDRMYLIHTGVPEQWSGRGIGGQLVREATRRARSEHLTVVPWCPFARRWLQDHPGEVADATIDWETPRPSP